LIYHKTLGLDTVKPAPMIHKTPFDQFWGVGRNLSTRYQYNQALINHWKSMDHHKKAYELENFNKSLQENLDKQIKKNNKIWWAVKHLETKAKAAGDETLLTDLQNILNNA